MRYVINPNGRRVYYDSRFDIRPYCYFVLNEDDLWSCADISASILKRCKKRFKSAQLSCIKMLRLAGCRNFECKVMFSITDEDRIRYSKEKTK